LRTYIRQEPHLRKLWSEYENVLGTPPPEGIKHNQKRLIEDIAAARISKKAEESLQNLPSLVDQLRKELHIVMEKIPDEQLIDRSVFNEWEAVINFSTKLLELWSQSIESGFDKSPISTFVVSEEHSMKKLHEEVEQFHSLPIVRVEGVRNPIRTLPWRKIDTADNLRTSRYPESISTFTALFNAIEEGIDNLSHVSDYLDRAKPRWEKKAKDDAEAYKRAKKWSKERQEERKSRAAQKLAAELAAEKEKEAAEKEKRLENAKRYQEKLDEKRRKKEEAMKKRAKAKAKQLAQAAKEKAEAETEKRKASETAIRIRKSKRRIGTSRTTRRK